MCLCVCLYVTKKVTRERKKNVHTYVPVHTNLNSSINGCSDTCIKQDFIHERTWAWQQIASESWRASIYEDKQEKGSKTEVLCPRRFKGMCIYIMSFQVTTRLKYVSILKRVCRLHFLFYSRWIWRFIYFMSQYIVHRICISANCPIKEDIQGEQSQKQKI